jgi:hypothetical protein
MRPALSQVQSHVSSPADWLETRVSYLGRKVYLHVGIRHRLDRKSTSMQTLLNSSRDIVSLLPTKGADDDKL